MDIVNALEVVMASHSMIKVVSQKPKLVEVWAETRLKPAQAAAKARLQETASKELRDLLWCDGDDDAHSRKEAINSLMELHGLTHSTSLALVCLLKTLSDHCVEDQSSPYILPFLSPTEDQMMFTNEFLRWQMTFEDG